MKQADGLGRHGQEGIFCASRPYRFDCSVEEPARMRRRDNGLDDCSTVGVEEVHV